MTYQVILVPNGSVGNPDRILNLINSHIDTALVITQSKTTLSLKFPKVSFVERTKKDVILDCVILADIVAKKPSLIVLDHCFLDNNSDLLFEIYGLISKQPLLLVNVLHIDTSVQHPNVSRLILASRIDFPLCDVSTHVQKFSKHLGTIRLYEFLEPSLPTQTVSTTISAEEIKAFTLKQTTKPCRKRISAESIVSQNKIEYNFYKTLLASLQNLVDMELFHGFLAELMDEEIKRNADFHKTPICLPLCNLNYMTNFYNRDRFGTFTPEMRDKYIQKIQPEIKDLLKNAPELLEKIQGFFVE